MSKPHLQVPSTTTSKTAMGQALAATARPAQPRRLRLRGLRWEGTSPPSAPQNLDDNDDDFGVRDGGLRHHIQPRVTTTQLHHNGNDDDAHRMLLNSHATDRGRVGKGGTNPGQLCEAARLTGNSHRSLVSIPHAKPNVITQRCVRNSKSERRRVGRALLHGPRASACPAFPAPCCRGGC